MKRKNVGILCLLLVLIMVVTALSACGRGGTSGTGTAGGTNAVTADENDPYSNFADQIGVRDLGDGGREFKILTVNGDPDSFFCLSCDKDEGYSGSPVADEMVARDQQMWELYGIDVCYETIGTGDNGKALRESLNTSILGGVYRGDMISSCLNTSILTLSANGLLYDCNSLPNMDVEHPWWASYFSEGATFRDKLYYTAGMAAGGGFYGTTYAMFANLYLMREVYLEDEEEPVDIFDLVNSGDWTLDTFYNIIKGYSRNLDGNDEFSVYSDLMAYAHVRGDVTAACHYIAAGGTFSTLDDSGNIVTDDLFSESTINLVGKLSDIFDEIKDNYNETAFFKEEMQIKSFLDSRALFMGNSMTYAQQLTEMKQDYAIIPCPKRDTAQENYYSGINPWSVGFTAFPSNIEDPDYVGYAVELLGYRSYYTVRPKLYNSILCYRLAKDPRQTAIMDTIYNNLYVDLNQLNDFCGSASILQGCIMNKQSVYSTKINGVKVGLPLAVDKFIKDMTGN